MRRLRWVGRGLLGLTVLFVLAAWFMAWSRHREEVNRLRRAFGPDAPVPAFNPVRLFDPATLPLAAWEFYVCAFAAGIPGLICLIMARPPRSTGNNGAGDAQSSPRTT
ncbi:MAG TPA: hypothetical protein VKD90_13350 [Gemmataceae bacterium]|nr:hypothetical protein [Gemmataceae bacterium]